MLCKEAAVDIAKAMARVVTRMCPMSGIHKGHCMHNWWMSPCDTCNLVVLGALEIVAAPHLSAASKHNERLKEW